LNNSTTKTEEWKQIKEFPRYYISDLGRVKSKVRKEEVILQQYTNEKGYKTITLYNRVITEGQRKRKCCRVHRLVA
jgi:hypothetical protein